MKTLFSAEDRAGVLRRLEGLAPGAERAWGRMDAAQVLAHLAATLEAAAGELRVRRSLLGRVLGPLFRGRLLGPAPFGRDAPTAAAFRVEGPRDFGRERARLLAVLDRFCAAGAAGAEGRCHAFLGPLTGEEWGRLMWKHVDHHLVQFGA
jgi:hypothetical protein